MGTSKSHREGPAWAEKTAPRGKEHYSQGSKSTAEGTHMSGHDEWGRKGMSNTARKKSKSGRTSVKAKVTTGQS